MSPRLRPLRDDELPAYIEHSRAAYAHDMSEQAGLSVEAAQQKAEADWARLLPDGQVPAGNVLLAIEDAATGERVGDLWCAERDNESGGKAASSTRSRSFRTSAAVGSAGRRCSYSRTRRGREACRRSA